MQIDVITQEMCLVCPPLCALIKLTVLPKLRDVSFSHYEKCEPCLLNKSLLKLNLQYNWNITEYIYNPMTNSLEYWRKLKYIIPKLSK